MSLIPCAVLSQRLGRTPYACKPKVAMRRRDNRPVISLQCVAHHSAAQKPHFFSSCLRYPACSSSLRSSSSGHLTKNVGSNLGYRLTPAEAPGAAVCSGSTAEYGARFDTGTSTKPLQTVFPQYPASSSTSPESLWCDRESGLFLGRSHGTETQPRKAAARLTPAGAACVAQ